MTVYLVISLPKYRKYTVYMCFWPTLQRRSHHGLEGRWFNLAACDNQGYWGPSDSCGHEMSGLHFVCVRVCMAPVNKCRPETLRWIPLPWQGSVHWLAFCFSFFAYHAHLILTCFWYISLLSFSVCMCVIVCQLRHLSLHLLCRHQCLTILPCLTFFDVLLFRSRNFSPQDVQRQWFEEQVRCIHTRKSRVHSYRYCTTAVSDLCVCLCVCVFTQPLKSLIKGLLPLLTH
jgi:hypothetical protein